MERAEVGEQGRRRVPAGPGRVAPGECVREGLQEVAAREAVLKALGTGFSQGIGLKDVSVTRDESGRPQVLLAGRAAEVAAEQGVLEIALSLSFTRDMAVANAVAVTEAARPHRDEARDPDRELAASFKEARSVIDELERLQEGLTGAVPNGVPGQKE